jgi:hypothetical protein
MLGIDRHTGTSSLGRVDKYFTVDLNSEWVNIRVGNNKGMERRIVPPDSKRSQDLLENAHVSYWLRHSGYVIDYIRGPDLVPYCLRNGRLKNQ